MNRKLIFVEVKAVEGELKMPLHAASSRELSSSLRQFLVAGGV
jgi:hypothetical protein